MPIVYRTKILGCLDVYGLNAVAKKLSASSKPATSGTFKQRVKRYEKGLRKVGDTMQRGSRESLRGARRGGGRGLLRLLRIGPLLGPLLVLLAIGAFLGVMFRNVKG